MRVVSGRVVDGRIEVEAEALEERVSVIVVLLEFASAQSGLIPPERDALLAPIAEADACPSR